MLKYTLLQAFRECRRLYRLADSVSGKGMPRKFREYKDKANGIAEALILMADDPDRMIRAIRRSANI